MFEEPRRRGRGSILLRSANPVQDGLGTTEDDVARDLSSVYSPQCVAAWQSAMNWLRSNIGPAPDARYQEAPAFLLAREGFPSPGESVRHALRFDP
jgi:hypothetical protein